MFDAFRMLVILCTAFGVILGIVKPKTLPRRLTMILFMPLLIAIVLSFLKGMSAGMNVVEQMLLWSIVLIVGFVLILRFLLGRELFQHVLGHFVYDVLKWFVRLPFRLFRAISRR